VGIVDRKRQLFENIVRLRRASRETPSSHDVVAVRSALERELGETVSRRLAASLLGVSHTALQRWTKAGDLPVVNTATGRVEVPVAALLNLYDAVEHERDTGRRSRHVLEPSMTEGRKRAKQIKIEDLASNDRPDTGSHRRAERRSLAYHRALAKRLQRPMIDEARHVLWKWRDEGKIDSRYAAEWEELLRRPVAEIRRTVGEDTQRGRDLRQNSPLAGMLSEPERRKIVEEVR